MGLAKIYTGVGVLNKIMDLIENLDKRIGNQQHGVSKGAVDMSKRLKDKVIVGGKTFWIAGYSNQELYESYVNVLEKEGMVARISKENRVPLLSDYLSSFYKTYKTRQQKNTIVNRERIIKNHILPKYGSTRLDQITTLSIQEWFNDLADGYSKETILKIKNILSPVLDSAVEDGLIYKNPIKSNRIENNGRETVHHNAIPKETMAKIRAGLPSLKERERYLGGILAYTGVRFEEALGLRYTDILGDWISVERAVVHPNRNQPIVKCPKTKTSTRLAPFPSALKVLLEDCPKHGYILASKKDMCREIPLSYTEARRAYKNLQTAFDIPEYTPHDFRDTCATEWREKGISLDVIARLLGHAKTETTEKRYVKYRDDIFETAKKIL